MARVSLMAVMPSSCWMLAYKLLASKVLKSTPDDSSTSFKIFIK